MTPAEAKALWEKVQANHRTLASCAGPHDFSDDLSPARTIGKRWRCTRCGGEVDGVARSHYQDGLKHGREEAARAAKGP